MPIVERPVSGGASSMAVGASPLQVSLRYLILFEWFIVIVVGFASLVLLVVCLLYVIYANALPEMTRAFGPLCTITGVSTVVSALGFAAALSLQRRQRRWPVLQGILFVALIVLGVTISATMGSGGK